MSYKGSAVSLKSAKLVKSVGLTKEYASVPASNGLTYVVISSATVSYSTDDVYYLSWE